MSRMSSTGHSTTDRGRVRERVESLVGPEGFGGREAREAGAPPIGLPSNAEETAALLRVAREEGWRVLPIGRRRGRALLPSAEGADLWIGSDRRSGIVEYEPSDLTIRVGAGTELFALDEVLAGEGQWLPLDPPGGRLSTLGGVVATGAAGPLATAFGGPRDLVLGLTLVDGAARVLGLGGRVVKNVAGFDLVRLSTGSRGRLGVIDEVSMRLYPRPRGDRILSWSFEDPGEAFRVGWALAQLPLGPFPLEVVDGEWQSEWELRARLTGTHEAVERLAGELRAVAGEPDSTREGVAARADADRRAAAEADGAPVLEVAVPAARGGDLLALFGPLRQPAEGRPGLHLSLQVHGGRARARGLAPEGHPSGAGARGGEGAGRASSDTGDLQALLAALARGIGSLGGRAELRMAPEAHAGLWFDHFGAAAMQPSVARIQRGIRETFDPHGILPGAWRWGWE